jgi:hypothetical protein
VYFSLVSTFGGLALAIETIWVSTPSTAHHLPLTPPPHPPSSPHQHNTPPPPPSPPTHHTQSPPRTMEGALHLLPHVKGYSTRTPDDKTAAHACDKATHAELRKLRQANPANKCCADCTASLTGWASLPHGVFLCIACAQVHRSLGRHMAQVKSFSSGTYLWYPDEVDAMRQMGNSNAAKLYASPAKGAPQRPDEHASAHTKEQYIRNKYERLKWMDPSFTMHAQSREASPTPTAAVAATERGRGGGGGGKAASASARVAGKGKGRAATTTKTPALQNRKVTHSKSTKTLSTFDPRLWDMDANDGTVTGQPSPTTTTAHTSLLDDNTSNSMCKASVMPPMRGLTALRSCAQSYKTAPSRARAGSGEDFFASWGL